MLSCLILVNDYCKISFWVDLLFTQLSSLHCGHFELLYITTCFHSDVNDATDDWKLNLWLVLFVEVLSLVGRSNLCLVIQFYRQLNILQNDRNSVFLFLISLFYGVELLISSFNSDIMAGKRKFITSVSLFPVILPLPSLVLLSWVY